MADVLTKEQRRKNMQHIKAKDTKIEVILRKALWEKGYRYRKNYSGLPGHPDIVLTKYKILSVTIGLKLKRIVATTDYMLADRFGRIEQMSRHRSHYLWIFNSLLPA